VGFGGGVFMVPILVIAFRVPINVAVGSVIFAIFPASVISTAYNMKNKSIDYLGGIILEIPTAIGTVLGAYLTVVLPIFMIEITFGVLITLIGINMIYQVYKKAPRTSKESFFYKINKIGPSIIRRSKYGAYRMSYLLCLIFGLISGIIAGFLGVGGGFLKIPIMVNVFGLPSFIASSTALYMIVFTSLTGTISHYLLGHINFTYAIPIVSGFAAGAVVGNAFSVKISENTLKILIGVGLIMAALAIIVYTLFLK
jgi:uncharacterized protein